jgi:uncharacterized protein YggE
MAGASRTVFAVLSFCIGGLVMLSFHHFWVVVSLAVVLIAPRNCWPADRIVSVSGSGLVSVPPDEVVIELSLSAVDDDLVRVRANSDKQVATILDVAKKHGSKPGDYEMSSLSLELSFNEQLKRQVYKVQREMSVKLGVLANLNPLLADLLKLPEMRIKSIAFGSSKARDHEREARRRAMADAQDTAVHLAELAGLKLGKAHQIATFTEGQRPFVTSVIPVVGKAGFFGHEPEHGPLEARSEPSRATAPEGNSGVVFVAVQAPAGIAQAAAPPADATFGLGQIDFDASVSIDFELVE